MYLRKIIFAVAVILLITGCSGPSAAEKMYEHMENAVTLEEDFAKQQEPLIELEQKEKQIYEEIIGLGIEEFETAKELSLEALEIIEQRREIIGIEKDSIEAAKEEFDKVQPYIEEIEDEELKAKASDLYQAMDERYNAYLELNKSYADSLTMDEELYQMFQQEDIIEEDLRKHIELVNESYDKVIKANDLFNEKTEEYNRLKREFYESAELNVAYEE